MKTEKYIQHSAPIKPKAPDLRTLIAFDNFIGDTIPNFKISFVVFKKAHVLDAVTHTHDFDQFLYFYGSDPEDMHDLHGEIEMTLSEDGKTMEKHVFTTATSIFIPKGLYHCPLDIKQVDKPIFHLNVFFSADYQRK